MWNFSKSDFSKRLRGNPKSRPQQPGPALGRPPFLELGAFLVWLEREVGENSAEEDPKGDDR
jgi:hypothetical protein